MSTYALLEYSMFAFTLISIAILAVMWRKKLLLKFYALTCFLTVNALATSILIATLFFRQELGISKRTDYNIYALTSWISACLGYVLMLLIIYNVFHQAMRPFKGLDRIGKVVFRWVYGVSLALVLGMSLGPHVGASYVGALTGQIQQGVSVLTLCLLLFVCIATRQLGLTFRSHIFGVSLGSGILATVTLIQAAWYSASGIHSLYSPVYVFSALGSCVALLTWGTYFALPNPEPKMVLLPTTSPYFLWNRISEALGDAPGVVAIAGFTPKMMAPAELTMLSKTARHDSEPSTHDLGQSVAARIANGTDLYSQIAMQR